jgi:uncharacterized protein (TIGR02271 family)
MEGVIMIDQSQLSAVQGCTVYGRDGEKIGKAGQVYLDDQTGRPEWVTVNTGLLGTNESFVPLTEATFTGDRLEVAYSEDMVKDAPSVDAESHLDESEEAELYRYYGLAYGQTRSDPGLTEGTRGRVSDSDESSAGTTDDAMTRSEEELRVGTEKTERGRARLRKYVTTEQQTVSVPVTREEVRVEREPITEENRDAATSGPDISEDEHEVTLHEERAVVEKETHPVERVRLDKEAVSEEEQVSEEVRKEQIDVDDESGTRRPER